MTNDEIHRLMACYRDTGDEAAFTSLYHAFYPPLVRFMRVRLWGAGLARDIADDLVDETFLKAARFREQFDECGNFQGWLFKIAGNGLMA